MTQDTIARINNLYLWCRNSGESYLRYQTAIPDGVARANSVSIMAGETEKLARLYEKEFPDERPFMVVEILKVAADLYNDYRAAYLEEQAYSKAQAAKKE